jgi:hypothetical protein
MIIASGLVRFIKTGPVIEYFVMTKNSGFGRESALDR